jgi:hypothetical protein
MSLIRWNTTAALQYSDIKVMRSVRKALQTIITFSWLSTTRRQSLPRTLHLILLVVIPQFIWWLCHSFFLGRDLLLTITTDLRYFEMCVWHQRTPAFHRAVRTIEILIISLTIPSINTLPHHCILVSNISIHLLLLLLVLQLFGICLHIKQVLDGVKYHLPNRWRLLLLEVLLNNLSSVSLIQQILFPDSLIHVRIVNERIIIHVWVRVKRTFLRVIK